MDSELSKFFLAPARLEQIEHLTKLLHEFIASVERETEIEIRSAVKRAELATGRRWKLLEKNLKDFKLVGLSRAKSGAPPDLNVHIGWDEKRGGIFGTNVWVGAATVDKKSAAKIKGALTPVLDGPDLTIDEDGYPIWCRVPDWPVLDLSIASLSVSNLATAVGDPRQNGIRWIENKLVKMCEAID
jgi:hypothetical protein